MSSVGSNSFQFKTLYIIQILLYIIRRCEQRRAIHVRCDFMLSFYCIRFLNKEYSCLRINLNIFILIQ